MLGIRTWLLVVTFSGISFAAPDGGDEVCKSLNDHFENVAWPFGTRDFHGSYGKNGRIDPQAHHAKHNFILIGRDEVFASHVVYKAPHNYQVLLQITFGESVKAQYLDPKARYPLDDLFLLLEDGSEKN